MRRIIPFLFLSLLLLGNRLPAQLDQLMPQPASVVAQKGAFRVDSSFLAAIRQKDDSRATAALRRFLQRLDGRTGLNLPDEGSSLAFPITGLNVWVHATAKLELHADESYTLQVSPTRIMLEANTDLGALRGLETLLQLLSADAKGYHFPACRIEDSPRFPWRGLLIDVCRHWQPVEVIKRNLDAMAAMKLNVFHWHLSEDQGFRIESLTFPLLHQLGSNGDYFTQAQVRDIIAYADARGIRVVPEFDIPGHATAWFVGHPELASAPGPYSIEKKFGVFDPAMDPTKESTYTFLESFLGEMCGLFPDAYFHIGGDENEGKQWDANPAIQDFMQQKGYKTHQQLQNHFNQRLLGILQENGKRMVGWDEILVPGLPNSSVIQSWRGKDALISAASQGYDVMLSSGYYIDLCQSTSAHYLNDPLPSDTKLDAAARKHVLGGEATMWAEMVTPETIDSRIWPRTCAIAERFWSPESIRDVADMYRRLTLASLRLEELGCTHLRNPQMMMRRLCQGHDYLPLQTLVEAIEPLPGYARHSQGIAYSTELPFTRLPDMAVPDPQIPRGFSETLHQYLAEPDELRLILLQNWLELWRDNHSRFEALAAKVPALRTALPLSSQLNQVAVLGLELLQMKAEGRARMEKKSAFKSILESAKKPGVECRIAILPAMEELLTNTLGQ
jgi:hexosaminidase